MPNARSPRSQKAELRVGEVSSPNVFPATASRSSRIAVDLEKFAHRHALGQLLAQIVAKRSWMVLLKSHILIQ